ncbi:relaxase family protein [Apilactobacillus timberlakei]|uniref:hypothetical protein n=1 Tax=Apilactobacillus timberlakei TaxID=2008380 RepID=UPI00112DFD61|nr:hypothetical protein [Apilactobacillus timberlakei]TPR16728.1 hypothetical protein DYZ95_07040 [Apilactobacillus timberlakei]TPR21590.1 hypothetical protein DY083_06090 [Apilactobacillus timberlakei]
MKQRSASIVKVSSSTSSVFITNYNKREKKINGTWLMQPDEYSRDDLLSFHGESAYDFDDLDLQAQNFEKEIINNFKIKEIKVFENNGKGNYLRNNNDTYTVIQSFSLTSNPGLTPREAHIMGNELFKGMQKYYKQNFNYNLESGFVSTHIDRDGYKKQNNDGKKHNSKKVLEPHLHNHIVVPAINHNGHSLTYLLSKSNVKDIRSMNDQIAMNHSLNDYYLLKLENNIKPQNKIIRRKKDNMTDIDIAALRFEDANNRFSYSEILNDFDKCKNERDKYLKDQYGYIEKEEPSFQFPKHYSNELKVGKTTKFTMKDFSLDSNNELTYYNEINLGGLIWNNKSQALNYKNIKALELQNVNTILQSPKEYQQTLSHSFINRTPAMETVRTLNLEHGNNEINKNRQKQKDNKTEDSSKKLANLIDSSQLPEFDFKVQIPLDYVNDDFSKRIERIKKEYQRLRNNERINEKDRSVKDKVLYVKKSEKHREQELAEKTRIENARKKQLRHKKQLQQESNDYQKPITKNRNRGKRR